MGALLYRHSLLQIKSKTEGMLDGAIKWGSYSISDKAGQLFISMRSSSNDFLLFAVQCIEGECAIEYLGYNENKTVQQMP